MSGFYILGVVTKSVQWKKMKIIWDACQEMDVTLPDEVLEFFGSDGPGDEEDEETVDLDSFEAISKYPKSGPCKGVEVDLSKLPDNVTIIRVLE